jgi:hypothetical protein
VTWEDMLKPFFGHISESRQTWVTRLLGKLLIMNDLIDLFIVFSTTFSFYAECIIMLHEVLLICFSIFFLGGVRFMVFSATFDNISVISWWSVVEEIGGPGI